MAANSCCAAGGKSGSRSRSIIALRAILARVARSPFEFGFMGVPTDPRAGDAGRIGVELWGAPVLVGDFIANQLVTATFELILCSARIQIVCQSHHWKHLGIHRIFNV